MNRKQRRADQSRQKKRAGATSPVARAVQLLQAGDLGAAQSALLDIVRQHPEDARAHHYLGYVAHAREDMDAAASSYRRATELRPDYLDAWFNLGTVLLAGSELSGAEQAMRKAIAIKADLPHAHNGLGNVLVAGGDDAGARDAYRKALALDDGFVDAWKNLALVHARAGDHAGVASAMQRVITIDGSAENYHELGLALQHQGETVGAEHAFREVVKLQPDSAEAWLDLGNLLFSTGVEREAVDAYRRALALRPDDLQINLRLGLAQLALGDLDDAETTIRQLLAAQDSAPAWNALGNVLTARERVAEAEQAYRNAVERQADSPEAWNNLGLALAAQASREPAIEAYRRALQEDPGFTEAYRNMAAAVRYDSGPESSGAIDAMNDLLEGSTVTPEQAMHVHFALGKALVDRGEDDAAFAHYQSGNRLRHAGRAFDLERFLGHLRRITATYSSAFFGQAARGSDDESPVFIVGMPRSGTTLVEQIIASHPLAHGAGELRKIEHLIGRLENQPGQPASYPELALQLDAEALANLSAEYLEHARQGTGQGIERVTDKMPFNFIHLGFITTLFPNARIIHCVRDPMDTCLSNYFHYFPRGAEYSYDLAELGGYFNAYRALMQHWQAHLPVTVHELDYDALVADTEPSIRALIDYLGLEWDDACLAPDRSGRTVRTLSAWQVRQPIYRGSQGRWLRYEQHLQTLVDALEKPLPDLT